MTFAYDPRGERVKKTTSSGSVRYPFAGYEIGSDGVITKRLGDVTKKSTGQVLFHHRDRLGSVHVITDSTGARVQLVEYDPWGSLSREEGAADLTDRLTEQELDRETGLYHFVGRYYDPLLSRFISPDPFAANFAVPQALNRYSYVRNNPVNRIDPTGFDDSDDSEEADPDGPPGEDPPGETNPPGAPEHGIGLVNVCCSTIADPPPCGCGQPAPAPPVGGLRSLSTRMRQSVYEFSE